MKKTFAAVVLLTALGVLFKLAWKAVPASSEKAGAETITASAVANPEAILLAKYTDSKDRSLVEKTLRRYHHTAVQIEASDGLRGLALLDKLDLEAIYLYEKHPKDFRRLRDSLTDSAAADLLVHWSTYFGMKRADDADRAVLVEEIARLSPSQRRLASKYPNALPLLLAEPAGVSELIERLGDDPKELGDALVVLDFVSLEHGAADLRAALRTLDSRGPQALEAFRKMGADGFALVALYGPVLDAVGDALSLDQSLILLRVNADDVDALLAGHSPEFVAASLRHVEAAGLTETVGSNPHALKLSVEFGEAGDRALTQAGPDAADVVYLDYADPTLRQQAVSSMAEYGTMALAMLDKYASDAGFREILRHYGPSVIPPIARADVSPEALAALQAKSKKSFTESLAEGVLALSGESGQATIRQIKSDGLDRVNALDANEVGFVQFLPLYDLLHLGGVVSRGQSPTSGEMTWAMIDGLFVTMDVLSLAAFQPEGAAAVEAARSEVKVVAREGSKAAAREAVEEAAEVAGKTLARDGVETVAERASRWWTVRAAGGTYRLLSRMPEALSQMSLPRITLVGRSLSAKAGMRLSEFGPRRFLKDGVAVLSRIPPEKGVKYLAAQGLQAGVGVVAMHKMEEHLASRRPPSP